MRNNELHLRDKDSERGDQFKYLRVIFTSNGRGTRRLTDGLVMRMQRYGCSTGLSW